MTAVAYDNPIPGFKTRNCINLRLWAAKPSREFDLEAFNTGDYVQVGGSRGCSRGAWCCTCACKVAAGLWVFLAMQPIACFAGTTTKHPASNTWF